MKQQKNTMDILAVLRSDQHCGTWKPVWFKNVNQIHQPAEAV